MNSWDVRKWRAIGTGVGIEIGAEDLNITVVNVRPGGVTVLGRLGVRQFRNSPASEWGAEYAAFLKKLGESRLAATVLLPREDVIVRQLTLPGVADRDLAAAIRFELDSLHPYTDEEPVFAWSRIGKTSVSLVAIARTEVVRRYSTLFSEAGVKVASFTCSAASLYAASRIYGNPAGGFLAMSEDTEDIEAYGESEARPIFSARLSSPASRARTLAIAELRLAPETEAVVLGEILPHPKAAPEGYDASLDALTYATALTGASAWPALSVNLLPADQRQTSSYLPFVPSAVLGALTILLAIAALAYPGITERRYDALLQDQVRRLQPRAQKAVDLDRLIATTRNRSEVLDNFRLQTKSDLDALNTLTKIMGAPPSWLSSLQLTRDSLAISGETDQAAGLLKLLDGSRQFRDSSFTMPISRQTNIESFSIRSTRQGGPQ